MRFHVYACLQSLGLRDYATSVRQAGLQYCNLPIVDMCCPEDSSRAHAFVCDLAQRVQQGQRVLIHCRCALQAPAGDTCTDMSILILCAACFCACFWQRVCTSFVVSAAVMQSWAGARRHDSCLRTCGAWPASCCGNRASEGYHWQESRADKPARSLCA